MKPCKSCKKEIDDAAIKCPYCQAYQSWYRSPQLFGILFPLLMLPLMFYVMGVWGQAQFNDYRSAFTVKKISEAVVEGKPTITYQIENNTDRTWNRIDYTMLYKGKSGQILNADAGSSYYWSIEPKSSKYLTVDFKKVDDFDKLEFTITNLRTGRFSF